jgi:hypothetical protein
MKTEKIILSYKMMEPMDDEPYIVKFDGKMYGINDEELSELLGDNLGTITVIPNFYQEIFQRLQSTSNHLKDNEVKIINEDSIKDINQKTSPKPKVINKSVDTYIKYNKKETKIGRRQTRRSLLINTLDTKGFGSHMTIDSLFGNIWLEKDSKNTKLSKDTTKNKERINIITTTIKEINRLFKKKNVSLHLKHQFDNEKTGNPFIKVSLD